MSDAKILDIFYNKLAIEAQTGKIDCFFIINMAFNLILNDEQVTKCNDLPYKGLIIPTLEVNDKEIFDILLVEYVRKALSFYSGKDFEFLEDLNIMEYKNPLERKNEYIVKYIICLLLANASFDDFKNPLAFLQTRIAMFDNKLLPFEEEICLGTINSIGAQLYLKEEKSPIRAETPYRLRSCLKFNNEEILTLPEIYSGSDGDKNILYGIQKSGQCSMIEEKDYLKKIRKGYIAKLNGAPEHYFLAVMLFLSLCEDKDIEIRPFLIQRWNAKRIALYLKAYKNNDYSLAKIEAEHYRIQKNITDILIRYFTKIEDVSSGLDITYMPFSKDSNLHLSLSKSFISRCKAFNEVYKLISDYLKNNNQKLNFQNNSKQNNN